MTTTAHQARAAANAQAYRAAVLAGRAADPAGLPSARLSAQLAAAGRRELEASRAVRLETPAARADEESMTAPESLTETMRAAELAACRAIAVDRLAEIRAELAELADALDPGTPEGHRAARAFHALTA